MPKYRLQVLCQGEYICICTAGAMPGEYVQICTAGPMPGEICTNMYYRCYARGNIYKYLLQVSFDFLSFIKVFDHKGNVKKMWS